MHTCLVVLGHGGRCLCPCGEEYDWLVRGVAMADLPSGDKAFPVPGDCRLLARLALAHVVFPNDGKREEAVQHLTARLQEVLDHEVQRLAGGVV